MVSTPLNNISQIRESSPTFGLKKIKIFELPPPRFAMFHMFHIFHFPQKGFPFFMTPTSGTPSVLFFWKATLPPITSNYCNYCLKNRALGVFIPLGWSSPPPRDWSAIPWWGPNTPRCSVERTRFGALGIRRDAGFFLVPKKKGVEFATRRWWSYGIHQFKWIVSVLTSTSLFKVGHLLTNIWKYSSKKINRTLPANPKVMLELLDTQG